MEFCLVVDWIFCFDGVFDFLGCVRFVLMVSLTSASVIGVFVYAESFGALFLCFLVKKVCLLSSVGFGRFLHLGGVVVFVSANAPAFCFLCGG